MKRRDFIKNISAATLICGAPRLSFGLEKIAPRADQVILLWMAGGMAHTETFDPKPHSEFRKQMLYHKIRSTFPQIDTVVDNIKISKGLEKIATVMDRATLIRSFSPPDLGHILHSRHQYHWHTGYMPPQTIDVPHIGSLVSKLRGRLKPDMPAFVHIGQRLDIDGSPEVKAFLTPGYLGSEHAPLMIPFPEKAREQISSGIDTSKFRDRNKLFKTLLEKSPEGEYGSGYHRDSLLKSIEDSYQLVTSPSAEAFNIYEEPKEVLAKYDTGIFGRGVLLARRLIEAGVRFVEVTTEHVPFGNWDTHNTGHERTIEMKKWIDSPVTQLVLDLEERGLLDRTLVILASEFSRASVREPDKVQKDDPGMLVWNKSQFGLHQHFTKAGSILMFGGGVKKGFVYGKSSDEVPCETIEDPITMIDYHASMYHLLGIPADTSFEIEKRPFYVTDNGEGKAVSALFA